MTVLLESLIPGPNGERIFLKDGKFYVEVKQDGKKTSINKARKRNKSDRRG